MSSLVRRSVSSVTVRDVDNAVTVFPSSEATPEREGLTPAQVLRRTGMQPDDILNQVVETSSEAEGSDWTPARGVHSTVSEPNSSASVQSVRPSDVVNARSRAKAVKKPIKRVLSDASISGSSTASTPIKKPAKKRVRTGNPLPQVITRAPSATQLVVGNVAENEFMNFTAAMFTIQLGGPEGTTFHAHESVLSKSPVLANEITKAKGKKRKTKQDILPLMSHDPVAFQQMLQYLYNDKFNLSKQNTAMLRIKEIHELMSLAKHYVLPGLQKQIVKLFSNSKLLSKITLGTFFDWAEDMYYEELDHENGPFKQFFSRVSPPLLKDMDEAMIENLVKMVKQGGGFAEELFKAAHNAVGLAAKISIKQDPDNKMSNGDGSNEQLFVQS